MCVVRDVKRHAENTNSVTVFGIMGGFNIKRTRQQCFAMWTFPVLSIEMISLID